MSACYSYYKSLDYIHSQEMTGRNLKYPKQVSIPKKYYSTQKDCARARLETKEPYLQSTTVGPHLSYTVMSAKIQNCCLFI